MWLVVKKFILAMLLPIVGLFSFPAQESSTDLPVAPPGALLQPAVPQPGMRAGGLESDPAKGRAEANSSAPAPSAAAVKECLAKPMGTSSACLDALFRKYLATHSTGEALAILRGFEESDSQLRLSCHPVVHAVGRETFRIQRTVYDSFAACDQTCHSGCYHGAMERFLRGDLAESEARHITLEELKNKSTSACDPGQATRFRFQCLHGLGHAVVFFSDYKLGQALSICDALLDGWSRSSCYGGAFMENVFSATPEKRDLSATDYHYPCSALPEKYKSDCYMMQTTRMSEMGLLTEKLFGECRNAGSHVHTCMQSIGRDLSNDARIGDPALVAKKCGFGNGAEREACTRGVVYALIDNTWDGRYAFPFCASYADPADATYCFSASVNYLRATFEKGQGEITRQCGVYVPQSQLCRDAALY